LVGHSYAGFVISGVAEKCQSAIASIVFLDAFLPDSGQALIELTSQQTRDLIESAVQKGDMAVPPRSAASFGVNEKDRAWVDAMCTPQPIKTFVQPVILSSARERVAKKSYVRAAGYANPGFDSALARAKSDRAWRTFELPCGHDVMVDMPDRLAAILQTLG
jgi:pimeloyl-ACP methyl ester carboxylesterase